MIRRMLTTETPKGWGHETCVANNFAGNIDYCGKLLSFKAGGKASMHYHLQKHETFYVLEGQLELHLYDLETATPALWQLNPGDTIEVPPGNPHQLIAITDANIIEFSTHHNDADTYRIIQGDSQLVDPNKRDEPA